MGYNEIMQEIADLRATIQKLLNNSKIINNFDANLGDINNLVLAVYNLNKKKTEKVPYTDLLQQAHYKGLFYSTTDLTTSVPNPKHNDFALIKKNDKTNLLIWNSDTNVWENIFNYINEHIADNTIHITEQDRTKWDKVVDKADKETVTNLTTKVNELIELSRNAQGLRNDRLLSLTANVPFEYHLPTACMLFALQPWGEQTIKIGSSATKTDDLGEFTTTTDGSVIQVGLLPNRSVWLTSNKSGLVDTIIYKGIIRAT